MQSNLLTNQLLAPSLLEVVREYCSLMLRPELSELEEERLAEILELANYDSQLNFWIDESNHFIGHELNLLKEDDKHFYKNQQAKMREYLGLMCQSIESETICPTNALHDSVC
jgi:hypothetical protein